jgi:poly-gamma-glutamate biosynthesis protein PgsC/CapC
MIELSITLGLVFSLLSYEVFGLAAGGIVVPGYIALQLTSVEKLLGTFIIAFATFVIIKVLQKFMFLYGRRQMVLSLLIGALLAISSRNFFAVDLTHSAVKLSAIGWVIPGLIANWFAKQGVFKTVSVLVVTAVLVRLLVILFNGGDLLLY